MTTAYGDYMRHEPYLLVTMYRKKPTLRVMFQDGTTKNYPLTKAACEEAARDIHKTGAESWMCSSSVDFPQEVKPRCRLDIREIMSAEFQRQVDEQARPQKEMVAMILAHCEKPEFQNTLTPKQQALFKAIADKTRKGE